MIKRSGNKDMPGGKGNEAVGVRRVFKWPGWMRSGFMPSGGALSGALLFLQAVMAFFFIFLFPPGAGAADGKQGGRISVFVSIAPQKYFVEQIAGDMAEVRVMAPPGASPAVYEPKPKQMAAVSRTKIYFAVGVPFESAWLKKIAGVNPDMWIVDTGRGIEKRFMTGFGQKKIKHHGVCEESHGHGMRDPHIWTSPPLVMSQARLILEAFQKIDPSRAPAYQANFEIFNRSLKELDAEFSKIFQGKQGMCFMTFHPSWGYFARSYGLTQIPIEMEGKELKPTQLKELIQRAKEIDIKVIFVQPQFSSRSARQIAREIGGRIAIADPLGENWMENMRNVALTFNAALK